MHEFFRYMEVYHKFMGQSVKSMTFFFPLTRKIDGLSSENRIERIRAQVEWRERGDAHEIRNHKGKIRAEKTKGKTSPRSDCGCHKGLIKLGLNRALPKPPDQISMMCSFYPGWWSWLKFASSHLLDQQYKLIQGGRNVFSGNEYTPTQCKNLVFVSFHY